LNAHCLFWRSFFHTALIASNFWRTSSGKAVSRATGARSQAPVGPQSRPQGRTGELGLALAQSQCDAGAPDFCVRRC